MPWCVTCLAEVRVLPPGCPRCASPAARGHPCWPATAPIDGMVAVYDYRGPVAAAVVTAKVGGASAGWTPLGQRLAKAVVGYRPDVDVVTWVTTPAVRVRPRGVDHARVLAHAVATALDVPLAGLLDAEVESQGRDRYLARLTLPGSNVLLVDDVVTTGGTAVRAATALRRAGAGRIVLAVLARAGTHALTGGVMGRGSAGSSP